MVGLLVVAAIVLLAFVGFKVTDQDSTPTVEDSVPADEQLMQTENDGLIETITKPNQVRESLNNAMEQNQNRVDELEQSLDSGS